MRTNVGILLKGFIGLLGDRPRCSCRACLSILVAKVASGTSKEKTSMNVRMTIFF